MDPPPHLIVDIKGISKYYIFSPNFLWFTETYLLLLQWARFAFPEGRIPECRSLSFLRAGPGPALSSNGADHVSYSSTASWPGSSCHAHARFGGLQDAIPKASDRIDASEAPSSPTRPVAVEILES